MIKERLSFKGFSFKTRSCTLNENPFRSICLVT
jgi:hypothetical protein